MDREDRMFVGVVGSKAEKVLRRRNIRLYNAFKERCNENSEEPSRVLGRMLLKFANSVLDGDDFHTDLLDTTINISALTRRKSLTEGLKEIAEIKKALSESESDEIDKLIHKLIVSEIERTTRSPIEMFSEQNTITIDQNMLYNLDIQSLDTLAKMAEQVKEEKIKAMAAERIEEVIEEEEEEVIDYGVEEEETVQEAQEKVESI